MARKFGKVNKIKVNPLGYNVGIIGESGIGKSTILKEMCSKLTSDVDGGYMILNMGMEDGVDAIVDAQYEDVPDWDTFDEIVDDIVENKLTDYTELKVVICDTMDEMFRLADLQVIRLHNRQNPDKTVKSINGAFGGYGKGEDKSVEIVLDKIKALKDVGVAVWFVGHTKKRSLTDVTTGIEYDMLTTNMPIKYFNAIKTKLHVLGVASIERDITTSKTGKKDFTGKEKTKGSVNSASRKITFRDDNFNIDSKSRFPDIVDAISFDTDELINAITDAIKVEFNKQKGVGSMEEEGIKQEAEKQQKVEAVVERQQEVNAVENLKDVISNIQQYLKDNKGNKEKLSPIVEKMKELEVAKVSEIKSIEDANAVYEICK